MRVFLIINAWKLVCHKWKDICKFRYHRCPGGMDSSYGDEWWTCDSQTYQRLSESVSGPFILLWQKSWGWANCLPDWYPECWHQTQCWILKFQEHFWLVFSLIQPIFLRELWSRMRNGYIILTLHKKPRWSNGSMMVLHKINSIECHLLVKWWLRRCILGLPESAHD